MNLPQIEVTVRSAWMPALSQEHMLWQREISVNKLGNALTIPLSLSNHHIIAIFGTL